MTLQDTLKSREIEILRLMADGLTNREISEQLYIGVETVRWYAKQIYSKLAVSGREEASQKAQELGLLDEETQLVEQPKKHKHNLPTQLTSFIGRESQIEDITNLLNETRLLTLTGPGGTGKTRLSIRVAETLSDGFDAGVCFVDLAPISKPDDIPKVIATALGVLENADESLVETLKRAIGERQLLLNIDNFEHVIDGASIISELLTATTNLKIIVTSREALRLSGEQEYPVPPLNMDETDSEAVMLFVQRAQRVRPSFRLDERNIDDIVAICKRLDGLPLAIELAAARCKLLTSQALLKRLNSRLASLTGGSRDAPKRQQTLQATIDWSYNLLDDDEKRLFERLAVFRSGRSLEAIETVCSDELSIDVFDGLASLVDKSMIRQGEDELGEPRFIMLETIQEYALQKLKASDDLANSQRRHASYYMELTERAAPELRLAHQEWWFTKLDIEQDNIRSSMAWALSGEDAEIGLRTVASLRDYWWYQGSHAEGWRWIEHGLEFIEDVPDKIRADVLLTGAIIAVLRHNQPMVDQFATDALSIYRESNDLRGVAWTLIVKIGDDFDEQIRKTEEALDIMRSLQDIEGQAIALNVLGLDLLEAEEYEQAKTVFEECMDISQQTGETRREVLAINGLGYAAMLQKQTSKAMGLFHESIALGNKLNFSNQLHHQLWACAVLFYKLDKLDVAMTLLGAAQSREQLTGQFLVRFTFNLISDSIEKLKSKLNEESTYQTAYEAGRKMSLDEAVAFALRELSDT